MSTAEIINELPKLSISERREIIRYLIELEEAKDAIQFSYESADMAFQLLDEIEKNV